MVYLNVGVKRSKYINSDANNWLNSFQMENVVPNSEIVARDRSFSFWSSWQSVVHLDLDIIALMGLFQPF